MSNNGLSHHVKFGKPLTFKQQDMYMNGLPKAVRNYLKFDAPIDWCPRSVYKYYRKYGGGGLTLQALKDAARNDTAKTYDIFHPQAGA